MAENFPYFKFIATKWLTGDIVYETMATQGLFVNICALYWQRDGKLSLDDLSRRYPKHTKDIAKLTDRFFSLSDGLISIKFLDEQLVHAGHISKVNSENGKNGGRPKHQLNKDEKPTANRPLTDRIAKKSKEEGEEELNKNKRKGEKKLFAPPTLDEVKKYFEENGYTGAERAFRHYADNDWRDANDKPVKNWKGKMNSVWFKEENKIHDRTEQTTDRYAGSRNDLKSA